MSFKNLRELYVDQLKDVYAACKSAMPAVTEMAREAQSVPLAEALIEGNRGIARSIDVIGSLFQRHEKDPASAACKAMDSLVAEARRQVISAEFADKDTRDAALIAQYQRIAHYAIAGLGTLRSFAARLDLAEDVAVLQSCLDATWDSDRRLTAIAETRVNPAAAEHA